jgi:hypothetical protein
MKENRSFESAEAYQFTAFTGTAESFASNFAGRKLLLLPSHYLTFNLARTFNL